MRVLPTSDEALLAGLAAGDPGAAAAFVRRFQGRVYGLAMTILGDSDVALVRLTRMPEGPTLEAELPVVER